MSHFGQNFSRCCCWFGWALLGASLSCPGEDLTNSPAISNALPVAVPESAAALAVRSVLPDAPLTNSLVLLAGATNDAARLGSMSEAELREYLRTRLELARHYRRLHQAHEAKPILVELLAEKNPDAIKQQALLELALVAKEDNNPTRAQQIYAQFLNRWPDDPQVPEVLLSQGQLFRQMGLNNLALVKFYGVMTSSLVLKNGTLEYYQRLVLLAQTEIAETHFELGKYTEAADFYSRLLKQTHPALNRARTQFRLLRSLAALGRNDEAVMQGLDFLSRYPNAPEQPEVRFHLALALKQLGRNNDALQQVLALLQEQKERTREHPELWAYWQQRAGNEIANQLYREGDYAKALDIYLNLVQLDSQLSWQLPVCYQIGLTYERLSQPAKALQNYQAIVKREAELGTNASPGLKAIIEMARWRTDFVQWQTKAESATTPGGARPDSNRLPQAAASPPAPVASPPTKAAARSTAAVASAPSPAPVAPPPAL